jgi:asparagine synthase (glutamine-hydrolysing)
MYMLSGLVEQCGIKVVLTGEGADEVFAGYDLFREGVVRRFWARQPGSTMRPRLLERLYPYLARSPVQQQAMARQFFGKNLDKWQQPGFAHGTRWQTTAALQRLLAPELRAELGDVTTELLADLPPEFSRWSYLAQDQYLEARTLLAGYLLASQGDRMLMAHSVEGRFPFLGHHVVELGNSLPDQHKLRVLDEKHVLKRLAADLVPPEIIARKKQPYRAPDAVAFASDDRPSWVDELLEDSAVTHAGVFNPRAVRTLWRKCQAQASAGQLSNTDNMALVAVVSTQLLHRELIEQRHDETLTTSLRTLVDRVAEAS